MEIRNALYRAEQIDKSQINTGKGLTEQSHANETDMNYILKEYTKTGYMKHAKDHQGKYDDVSPIDFQTAMFKVTEAQNMFNELPGQLRKEFHNNPNEFLQFVQNPDNENRMAKLGILRGNDGIDVQGAAVNVPTSAHYKETTQQLQAEQEAAAAASEEQTT